MQTLLFTIYALIACGAALAVVLSQNVVRMAFWLVISLSSVAGIFFMLDADFIGATQLLIYVGGTVVLLIFGVMLTASGPFLKIQTNPGELVQAGAVGLAFFAFIGGTVLSVNWEENSSRLESVAATNDVTAPGYNPPGEGGTVRDIGMALLGVRAKTGQNPADSLAAGHSAGASSAMGSDHGAGHSDAESAHTDHSADVLPAVDQHDQNGSVAASTSVAQAGYLLPFEIISVHLLVVLVGAAYLARAKRRLPAEQTPVP